MTDKEKPRKKRLLDPINPSSQPLLDLRIEKLKNRLCQDSFNGSNGRSYNDVICKTAFKRDKWKWVEGGSAVSSPEFKLNALHEGGEGICDVCTAIDIWYAKTKKELKGKEVDVVEVTLQIINGEVVDWGFIHGQPPTKAILTKGVIK